MESILPIIFWTSLGLFIYPYIIYPLMLLLIDRVFGLTRDFKTFGNDEELPCITILIAAYNEEKVIRTRIENCLSLNYPLDKMEIIIASDGSDDQTNSIVGEYADRGVRLAAFEKRQGKVNVLNQMVPQAKHDLIVFSDANTMFMRHAMHKLVQFFADERVGAVCGSLIFVSAQGSRTGDLEGFYWRYETYLKKMEGKHGTLLGANGAIYGVRRELYEPPPSDTIVEDFVIPMKILQKGFYVVYEPEAVATEESAKHIIQEKNRRIRIGAGDYQALFRLMPMINPFRGFSSWAFWSHKILRWAGPFLMAALFVSNVFLCGEPLYLVIFICQTTFYIVAFVGQMLSWADINIRFLNLPYYFVSMNLALFLGFIKFLTGRQKVTWVRTER